MPRLLAPSISSTSTSSPAAMALQMSHSPQGVGVGPLLAVEGLGEDAGGGGLADAAGAGEQVGVGDAVAGEGVGQGPGDGLLADEVGERLRPVAAGEDGVGLARGGRRRRVLGLGGLLGHGPWLFLRRTATRGGVPEEVTPRHSVRCLWLLPSRPDQVRNFPLGGSPPGTSPRVRRPRGRSARVFSLVSSRMIVTLWMTIGFSGRRPPSRSASSLITGFVVYLTSHVQPLRHFSEERVVAVEERGLAQADVEPAGGACPPPRRGTPPNTPSSWLITFAGGQLVLQPVADAAGAGSPLPCGQPASRLSQLAVVADVSQRTRSKHSPS